MNLNPFVFSCKNYPNSKLATAVNKFCGAMQRIFFLFAICIILVVVVEDVSNWVESLCGAGVMLFLWLLIKFKKNKWSDNIAAKQEAIDNPSNSKE